MQRSSPLAAMHPVHPQFMITSGNGSSNNGWACRSAAFTATSPGPSSSLSGYTDLGRTAMNFWGGSSTMTTTTTSSIAPMAAPSSPHNLATSSSSTMKPVQPAQNNGFNFRDLSMLRTERDYFNHQPVRGSSPTTSLAADLSSNFHIDQSPQVATPRRSLFSTNVLGSWQDQGPTTIVTPPIPSSSPGPCPNSMEISPLPHKPAYYFNSQQLHPGSTYESPVRVSSPNAEMTLDGAIDALRAPQERKRQSILKPSLSRAKLTNTAAAPKYECPPFRFGGAPIAPGVPSYLDLGECFDPPLNEDDQGSDPDSSPRLPMGPPRYRPSSFNLKCMGIPSGNHVRKSSNPSQRPRKQFRRSQSMYQHPDELMRQEAPPPLPTPKGLDPIMDLDDPPKLQLPHFIQQNGESLPRISKETMIDVLDGHYDTAFDNSMIVDCRFEYEFDGGHIDGAINYNDKDKLVCDMFEKSKSKGQRTLLIFHCEYSAHRAPLMAKHLRNEDRRCNAHRYPQLNFPEVYILDGGYSAFYADHKLRCLPQNYITMSDEKHENDCERGMGRVKKQQRAKLARAQTFAFGQHGRTTEPEDSPTSAMIHQASTRLLGGDSLLSTMDYGNNVCSSMDISFIHDSPLASLRAASRRLATC